LGEIKEYKCKCGYIKAVFTLYINDLKAGEKYSWIPALCEDCSEIVTIKSNDKKPKCEICKGNRIIPYSNPSLSVNVTETKLFSRFQEKNDLDKIDKSTNNFEKIIESKYKELRKIDFDELSKPQNYGKRMQMLKEPTDAEQREFDDEFLDSLFEDWQIENYYEAVTETYYKCPKCGQFLMKLEKDL